MKSILLFVLTTFTLLSFPNINFAQAPTLGTAADFVLFSSNGAVTNVGISQLTGNVGTNSGSATGFGNVNGVMHENDGATAQCAADLLIAYNQLNSTIPTFLLAPLLGNGDTLKAGVFSIPSPAVLNLGLVLDAQGDPNAVFIFQIDGAFSTNAFSKIQLLNGTQACNVFWKVEGLVDMAAGTSMKGTIIANNAAINMSIGDTLEGRALSTTGAVTVSGVLAYTPIGCGSPILTGPGAPPLGSTAKYGLFSSNGPVTNTGITHVKGDVGTNVGLTTGFDSLLVTGTIHLIPDTSTANASADLLVVYNYLNTLPNDIELLYPAQFGNNLVLTPHTYIMNGAVTFTDTLYLNAQGDPNAVFVIKVKGALSTSTYSKVKLINGTQGTNVYWMIDGAVDINDYSVFNGTVIVNNGAINVTKGVVLNGRVLTTNGALNVSTINARINDSLDISTQPANRRVCDGDSVSFTVAAVGTGFSYQWRKGSVILTDGGAISGANTDTLTINPVDLTDASSDYNVIITGGDVLPDTSDNAILRVNTAPKITTQPSNMTACAGDSASFSVVATGAGLTYQWRKGLTDLVSGGNIGDPTSAILTFYPVNFSDTATNYNVVITGTCFPKDSSINVTLVVNGPDITSEPSDLAACIGDSVSFAITATGDSLTYQWRKGTVNLVNGGNISGANSDTLTINPISLSDTSSYYNVIVTGTCSKNDTSQNVSLLINNPNIKTQPVDKTVCNGDSTGFSVAVIGTGLTYQWRKGTVNLIDTGNVSGANSDSLIINPVRISDTASNYNVVIKGMCLPNDTSINVALKLNTVPIITTEPIDRTICAGDSVSFIVAAKGAGLTYQWRRGNLNLSNGGNISGVDSDTLTFNPSNITDTASNYNVVVSGFCTAKDTSVSVSLMLNYATITSQPVDPTVCIGDSVSFAVAATGNALTYQWRKGTVNLVNGGNISGATSDTLRINPVNSTDGSPNYNVIVSGTCPKKDTSNNVPLIIGTPKITSQPNNKTACAGSPVSLSVGATGKGLMYQWRKGTTNVVNGGTISGATSNTLTISATNISDTASNYNVIVSGVCSPSDTSRNVSIKLNVDPSITTEPSDKIACIGSAASFSVTAIGTGLTYQWRKGVVDLIDAGTISGAHSATLTINPASTLDTASNYNVVISGTCSPTDTSTNVSLSVKPTPTLNGVSDQTLCNNGTTTAITFSGGIAGTVYNWTNNNTSIGLVGSGSGNIGSFTVTNSGTNPEAATILATPTLNGCDGANISFTIKVNPTPIATINSNYPVCTGSAIHLSTPTLAGTTYSWTGPNGFVSGSNNSTPTTSATPSDAGIYSLTITTNNCPSAPTSTSIVIIDCSADLSIAKSVNNTKPDIASMVVFTIVATNNGPHSATGVTVTDILKSGYTYVSSSASNGTYNPSTSSGAWIIGTLNSGTTETLTVTATVNTSGDYTNTATITGNEVDGKMDNNTATVTVFPTAFFIPEAFTPNGDGINDLFNIRGIAQYPHNSMVIFNRWGDKVFEARPYQNTWDGSSTVGGTVGGSELPVSTYFYVFTPGDGSDVTKGTIYLGR